MNIAKHLAAAAALSLVVAPTMASADASNLSVAKSTRAASHAQRESNLAGGGGFVVAIIAVIAVIAGIIIVANEDDDSDSN